MASPYLRPTAVRHWTDTEYLRYVRFFLAISLLILTKTVFFAFDKKIFLMKLFRLIFLLRFRQVLEWIFLHEEGAMRAS